jgi:kinesin family protein 12
VNDLLNMNAVNLPVRQSHVAGFFVENSFIVEIQSFQDLMDVLQEGLSNRKVGAHELNKDSSRSHSLFTVYVDVMTTDKDDGFTSTKYGKIVFVDLAGSERLKESLSSGDTAKETGHINKSLFTLSN